MIQKLKSAIGQHLNVLMYRRLQSHSEFHCPLTNSDDIQKLISRLHPIKTQHKLIRMGPNGDGGYLVPDDLEGIEACFSPGVSMVSGFEKECANRGMQVFMADNSVDNPADEHELFHFTKKFIGVTTNRDFMTLDDWVNSSVGDTNSDLLLQIDIEGFEYETFLAMSDKLLSRFRIIVVEFHDLEQLWNRPFFRIAARVFDKILQTHACLHHHPNNCCGSLKKAGLEIPRVTEFTFLRQDRITESEFKNDFPDPLDFDNTDKESLYLPECWYRK